MNVSLTQELEKLVHRKVQSGLYGSASEVVRESLRLLDERDRFRQERLRQLRKDVAHGLRQLDSGQYTECDEDSLGPTMDRIKAEGRRRLAKARRKKA